MNEMRKEKSKTSIFYLFPDAPDAGYLLPKQNPIKVKRTEHLIFLSLF